MHPVVQLPLPRLMSNRKVEWAASFGSLVHPEVLKMAAVKQKQLCQFPISALFRFTRHSPSSRRGAERDTGTRTHAHSYARTRTPTHSHEHTSTHVRTHTCLHAHSCAHTHGQRHTRARTCSHTHMLTHMHACAHTHMFTRTCIHMCTHMFTFTRVHTCSHTPLSPSLTHLNSFPKRNHTQEEPPERDDNEMLQYASKLE